MFVGSKPQSLLNVSDKKQRTDLYQVTFDPDGAVEMIPVPSWGMQTLGEPLSAGKGLQWPETAYILQEPAALETSF